VVDFLIKAAERVKTMEQLQAQLEVVLKPKLQQAIQKEVVTSLHVSSGIMRSALSLLLFKRMVYQ